MRDIGSCFPKEKGSCRRRRLRDQSPASPVLRPFVGDGAHDVPFPRPPYGSCFRLRKRELSPEATEGSKCRVPRLTSIREGGGMRKAHDGRSPACSCSLKE